MRTHGWLWTPARRYIFSGIYLFVQLEAVNNSLIGKSKLGNFNIAGLEQSEAGHHEIKLSSDQEVLISFRADDVRKRHLRLGVFQKELDGFEEQYGLIETEHDDQFEKTFQLKAKVDCVFHFYSYVLQRMPEFYQNMGKAALSLALSSLYTENRVFEATGLYNSRFTLPSLHFTHLHLPEGCEDLRTQGLAALSIIDLQPAAVLQVCIRISFSSKIMSADYELDKFG